MGRADMLRRIRASGTWEAAIACGLVALAGALAWVFRPAIDPLGCASILLAPIAITGLLYGMRTAVTAAGLAYLLFALLVAEPVLPSNLRDVGRYLTPPVFVLTALIAGGVTRILRASRGDAGSGSQAAHAILEATAFFNVTPNEDAIRQKLADTVAAMTRSATVVTDRYGRLRFYADTGADGFGPLENELEDLVSALIRKPQDQILTRREICGRLIRTNGEMQGVVVWRRPPPRDRARTSAAEEHVDLLADLAGAALARSGRDTPAQTRSPIG